MDGSANEKNPLGQTGRTVAMRVRELRERDRYTYVALSERLAELGRRIPPLGLRRVEAEERRVDADDLVALAQSFDVSVDELLGIESPSGPPRSLPVCDGCGLVIGNAERHATTCAAKPII